MKCLQCPTEFTTNRKDKKYCCVKCKNKARRRRDKNRWKCHKRRNWRRSNISTSFTINDYNILVGKQGNKCAICNRHRLEFTQDLAVDHDHITGKIRGLLCHKCNVGLGYFKDDVLLVKKAAEYLQS